MVPKLNVAATCALVLLTLRAVSASGAGGERSVGNCLVVGLTGKALDDSTALALKQGRIAGLILLSSNIDSVEQVQAITRAARKAALAGGQPEPLLCIDQEGGRVNRLKNLEGFPSEPPAAVLSKEPAEKIEELSFRVGKYIRQLGLNLDFAPDVDLDQGNGIIGNRSFGEDPDLVAQCASAVVQGLERAGVASIIKHYPGHGMTRADSHVGLPKVSPTRDELERHESPFAKVMGAGPEGAMLGHLLIQDVDPNYPASLSPIFAQQLRRIVGPDRLIFTDSGSMEALQTYGSEASRAAKALSSGVDVYLTTTPWPNLGKGFDGAVLKRIDSGLALKSAAARVQQWRRHGRDPEGFGLTEAEESRSQESTLH